MGRVKGESIGMCGCRVIIIAYGSVQKLGVQVNFITLFSCGHNFIIFQSQDGLKFIVNTKIGFEKISAVMRFMCFGFPWVNSPCGH